MHSSDSVVPVPDSWPTSGWYHHRSLLLASLTGSERRGNFVHGARPRAVALSSRWMSSSARVPDWEREEGKLHPWRPASCRRPGGCRLLLASLTGSERRGNLIHGARPCAVAPSSRRKSSPALIPDWEREEGKPHPWRPALCRRPVIPVDVVFCSRP